MISSVRQQPDRAYQDARYSNSGLASLGAHTYNKTVALESQMTALSEQFQTLSEQVGQVLNRVL